MIVKPGLRRAVSTLQRLFNGASFDSPLTYSAIPVRADASTTGTFTRATTKTWPNNDGYLVTGVAGEIGFVGARRVRNLIQGSTETLSTSPWAITTSGTGTCSITPAYSTAPDGTQTAIRLQSVKGTGNAFLGQNLALGISNPHISVTSVWAKSNTGSSQTVVLCDWYASVTTQTVTTEWTRISRKDTVTSTSTGFVIGATSAQGDANIDISIWHPQLEDVTAQSTQSVGPYVSVGVASSPYYHGSMVDGVKCFATDINGSPIPSSTLLGYQAEGARTNHFLQSGTPATQTSGSLSTGTYTLWMDGTGSIAVAGATATITGAGTATSASAVTFTVTVAGTVTYTVTGSPTRAQSENGAFRSSYIPTTTIAVARNADVLTYSSAGNILGTVGAAYAELGTNWSSPGGQKNALGFSAGIDGFINHSGSIATGLRIYDSTNSVEKASVATMQNSSVKYAGAWSGSAMSLTGGGAAVATGSFDGSIGGTTIAIGCSGAGTSNWDGTIRNVRIWQRALSSSELQAVTA